jgi:hypothetical protein
LHFYTYLLILFNWISYIIRSSCLLSYLFVLSSAYIMFQHHYFPSDRVLVWYVARICYFLCLYISFLIANSVENIFSNNFFIIIIIYSLNIPSDIRSFMQLFPSERRWLLVSCSSAYCICSLETGVGDVGFSRLVLNY